MIRTTRFWMVFFAVLLCICGGASWYLINREPGSRVAGIYQDGALIRRINLEDGQAFEFTISKDGMENQVCVDEEGIRIIRSNCPDQTCVKHGNLQSGAPIVCLPHHIVIKWENETDAIEDIDAVTGG